MGDAIVPIEPAIQSLENIHLVAEAPPQLHFITRLARVASTNLYII